MNVANEHISLASHSARNIRASRDGSDDDEYFIHFLANVEGRKTVRSILRAMSW